MFSTIFHSSSAHNLAECEGLEPPHHVGGGHLDDQIPVHLSAVVREEVLPHHDGMEWTVLLISEQEALPTTPVVIYRVQYF